MNINLLPYAVFWGVLAIVVVSLVVYRKSVSSHEDDSIHLEGNMPTEQLAMGHKLAMIDRWGKLLTVLAVVYGLALAAVYMYQIWNNVPTY
jgi:heme/copper-type cytochrome/quinol oxidase subunit 2